jgi:hypothetical protein
VNPKSLKASVVLVFQADFGIGAEMGAQALEPETVEVLLAKWP